MELFGTAWRRQQLCNAPRQRRSTSSKPRCGALYVRQHTHKFNIFFMRSEKFSRHTDKICSYLNDIAEEARIWMKLIQIFPWDVMKWFEVKTLTKGYPTCFVTPTCTTDFGGPQL